jgi:hypothetical protein
VELTRLSLLTLTTVKTHIDPPQGLLLEDLPLLLRTALLGLRMGPLLLVHAALLFVLLLLLLLAQGAIAPASPCSWRILRLSLTQLVQLEQTLQPSPDRPQNKAFA